MLFTEQRSLSRQGSADQSLHSRPYTGQHPGPMYHRSASVGPPMMMGRGPPTQSGPLYPGGSNPPTPHSYSAATAPAYHQSAPQAITTNGPRLHSSQSRTLFGMCASSPIDCSQYSLTICSLSEIVVSLVVCSQCRV